MKLVIDTDVLYAGLYSQHGASRQLLNALWPPSNHQWLMSVATMLEYEAVLKRKKFLDATQSTKEDIDMLLNAVADFSELVHITYHWRPLAADPSDDHIAETAVCGDADAIITYNQKDFNMLPTMFNTMVLSPKQWLEGNKQ